ncbi:MAG: hypothetical protein M3464_12095 [Chloroflexota bacterium]|nr:hypothetical protein [Chloroflexota bacterium]
MRTWQPIRLSHPILSLLTGACVTLAVVALILAATAAGAIAESTPAKVAVNPAEMIVTGTVVGVGEGLIGIQEAVATVPVAFPVAAGTMMSRDGAAAGLADLRQHDAVSLTVDPATGTVSRVVAESAPGPMFQPSNSTAAVAALGLIIAAIILAARLRPGVTAAGRPAPRRAGPIHGPRLPRLSLPSYGRSRQPGCQA